MSLILKQSRLSSVVMAGVGAIMIGVTGCDSKSVESSPDSIKIKGLSLDTRLSEKSKVDSKIDEIQQGADKAKRIIDMFRRVQNPSSKEDVYTPVDFLLDVNNELKSKIPENQDGKLVRRGKVVIPVSSLSPECKTIETLLESGIIYDESSESISEKVQIGEKLTYSLKSCGSDGKYLPAVEAYWVDTTLEFKLINKNLETIFSNVLITDALRNSVCKIKQGQKNIIENINCENFKVKLSPSEYAIVNKMALNNSGDVRFESLADIFENDFKKASSQIQVFSNGEVKVEVKKVEND